MCARTYKLLGACSCVLSFKAEFFRRNEKQLISIWMQLFHYFENYRTLNQSHSFADNTRTHTKKWKKKTINPHTLNKSNKIRNWKTTNCVRCCSDLQRKQQTKQMFMFCLVWLCNSFTDRPEHSIHKLTFARTHSYARR